MDVTVCFTARSVACYICEDSSSGPITGGGYVPSSVPQDPPYGNIRNAVGGAKTDPPGASIEDGCWIVSVQDLD